MASISDLQVLIDMLRRNGITEYSDGAVTLKLGPLVRPDTGPVESMPSQLPRMSEDLAAAMKRLSPLYSDESLFAFGDE